jgi:hypothetical protein
MKLKDITHSSERWSTPLGTMDAKARNQFQSFKVAHYLPGVTSGLAYVYIIGYGATRADR